MEYNKDSFLAGVAVGRRLKGWSGGEGPSGGTGEGSGLIYDKTPLFMRRGKVLTAPEFVVGEYRED